MGKRVHQTPPPTTAHFVDPFRDKQALTPITGEERTILRTVNQKIAARPSLRAIVDYLFENTQALIPCDRIGLAFVDERGERVTSYYNRADYEPLYIDKDYSEALRQTSLSEVLRTGQPRIIGNLELYLEAHPRSRSTRRLVQEGVRSNLACPLSVEGRIVGFIFRSSRRTHAYRPHHIELQMAISERLSQAVEKAWRIEQLEEVNHAYTQMLAFVSHELKSPVASMVTDAELMSQGYLGDLTDVQLTKLEGMARKGRYLLGLVNEYLDLARVESGELTLDPTSRVNVNEQVIGEALELVAPQIEARRRAARHRAAARAPAADLLRRHAAAHRPRQPSRQRREVRQRGWDHQAEGRGHARTAGQPGQAQDLGVEPGAGLQRRPEEQVVPTLLAPRRPGPQDASRHGRRPLQRLAHHPAAQGTHQRRLQARRVGGVQF